MAKIMLDFSGMPETDDNDLLPEGQYRAVVVETEEGTSKTGNAKVDLTFKITEPGEHEGRKQWYTITSSEKARRFTRRALVALGYDFSGLTGAGVLDLDQTIGNEVILVVEHQEYLGKVSAKTVRLEAVPDEDEAVAVAAPTPAKKKVAWIDLAG